MDEVQARRDDDRSAEDDARARHRLPEEPVDARASRKASVTRCWAPQPARPRSPIHGQCSAAIVTQPGAASAPAPSASIRRNQNTIDAVFSVDERIRTITTTMAQQNAEPSAARAAMLTKPAAVGLSITRTPVRPTRIA